LGRRNPPLGIFGGAYAIAVAVSFIGYITPDGFFSPCPGNYPFSFFLLALCAIDVPTIVFTPRWPHVPPFFPLTFSLVAFYFSFPFCEEGQNLPSPLSPISVVIHPSK